MVGLTPTLVTLGYRTPLYVQYVICLLYTSHIVPPKILCPPYYYTNDQKQQLSSKIPLKILCKTKKILAEIMKLYYNNNVR